jgi:hypothetical protein
MFAGSAPRVLGEYRIDCPELMFYQYLPIVMPEISQDVRVPDSLRCFMPIINEALWFRGKDQYMYLTAKKMFVGPDNAANRPGWHIDGFGTDDFNFIWADSSPTEFCVQQFVLSEGHGASLRQMDEQARVENITTYPDGSLLMLDQTVVHRVAAVGDCGYRTFAKISISSDRYNLRGNARNWLFDYDWPLFERSTERNHPIIEPGAVLSASGLTK